MANQVRDWFTRIRNCIPNFGLWAKKPTAPDPQERLTKTLGKFEKYIYSIQSILIWDDPVKSALWILAVNILFWFLVSFHYRFYGVLFTIILALFCYDLWVERIWPEISVQVPKADETNVWTPQHPSSHVLTVPEISSYVIQAGKLFKRCCRHMVTLREEQPAVFCGEMCGVFGALTVIGRTVPGSVIGYCVLMSVLIGPGVYIHVLPPTVHARLAGFAKFFQQRADTDSEIEDMLPDATTENLALFHLAGESDNSDKDESNEFALGPDLSLTNFSLTSPHNDRSLDDIAQFEAKLARSLSDSDSDEKGIHFRSSHFNGNSSSEDEEAFAEGLTFTDSGRATDVRTQDTSATLMSGLAQNLTSLGASLVTSVMNRAAGIEPPHPLRRRRSSDSEDFEMISSEELS